MRIKKTKEPRFLKQPRKRPSREHAVCEDQVAYRNVVDAALPWLKEGKYNLVLIHIDQVDYAGHHEGGPIDPRWDAAATRADGLLNEIASAMDLSQDTLIIFSDHGQIDRGGHGGQDPIVLLEPFVMVGKGVVGGKFPDVKMVDIAPTVAARFKKARRVSAGPDLLPIPDGVLREGGLPVRDPGRCAGVLR